MMHRLGIAVLVVAVVVSAVAVVVVRHDNRVGFSQLVELHAQRDTLATEWGRLQLERATLAGSARVDRIARESMGLRMPQTIQVLSSDG